MSDTGVEATKGQRPVLSTEERLAQIRSLLFVADALTYDSTDQRKHYEALRPDIIVQGDDWLHSADRATALEYIRAHGIRLVLLPRTEGISTTEIRKRVQRSVRRDEMMLLNSVRAIPLPKLRLYEEYDEEKVLRLVDRISASGLFLNPIAVVEELVVIDGVNRLEALRRLGATVVPCVVYNYGDVDLQGNVHFIKDGKKSRLSEFAPEHDERIVFPARTPDDIIEAAKTGQMIPNGETFHRLPFCVIRIPIALASLRSGDLDLHAELKVRFAAGQVRFLRVWLPS